MADDKSITKPQHFPPVLEDWARSAKRHPLDPHLEDVQAVLDQGNPDPSEDRSFRGVILPANEESGGRRRLAIISARAGHAQAVVEEMATGNLFVESVEIERPGREAMARVLDGVREMVALPPKSEETLVESRDAGPVTPGPFEDFTGGASLLCAQCRHPRIAHEGGRCVAVVGPREQCSCGLVKQVVSVKSIDKTGVHVETTLHRHARVPTATPDAPPFRVTSVAPPVQPRAVAVEPTDRAPFVLRIRQGRNVVHEAGPFSKVTDAIDAMQSRGEAGQEATVYERGRIADYRGGRAVYSFGRTRWSRAS